MTNEKVYVPEYDSSTNCAYIYNSDIIRVYESTPRNNTTIAYKDYYIKNDYIYNEGTTTFNQYSTLPTCITSSRITTDVYYRNDIMQILVIFFILAFVCLWCPWKILCRVFRRWN